MEKNEMQMLGFEIVAYSGDARSQFLQSIELIAQEDFEGAKKYYQIGEKKLLEAHTAQMELLQKEAKGVDLPYSLTMVHAQDHLMSAVLLRDVIQILLKNK